MTEANSFNVLKVTKIFVVVFLLSVSFGYAKEDEGHGDSFEPQHMIMHHIKDSHSWHFFKGATLHLPVFVYSSEYGLDVFNSSDFYGEHHEKQAYDAGDISYVLKHGTIYFADQNGNIKTTKNEAGETVKAAPLDLSITKNVFAMFISVALMLIIFLSIANKYKKQWVPKGAQSLFEPVILFVRDDVARDLIGEKYYERFMPYLLTLFFFILFNNILGLLPAAANVTGNIAVTGTLAVFTLIITLGNSNKHYWSHIFDTPGVPFWLKYIIPVMPVVELIGIFTKPFALMIRLFANIMAGHIIILSLLGLIFIFKSYAVPLASIPFSVFMNFLEILVAFIQAYIFTLLSAMYFGGAVEEHHEEEEAEPAAG